MDEPKRTVKMKGQPVALAGAEVKVGQPAPDFQVLANARASAAGCRLKSGFSPAGPPYLTLGVGEETAPSWPACIRRLRPVEKT